jgi:hypothetical protein
MPSLAKIFLVIGGFFILLGASILLFSRFKVPYVGRLPGDIFVQKDNFTFYFPLTTSTLVSLILSLMLYLFSRK